LGSSGAEVNGADGVTGPAERFVEFPFAPPAPDPLAAADAPTGCDPLVGADPLAGGGFAVADALAGGTGEWELGPTGWFEVFASVTVLPLLSDSCPAVAADCVTRPTGGAARPRAFGVNARESKKRRAVRLTPIGTVRGMEMRCGLGSNAYLGRRKSPRNVVFPTKCIPNPANLNFRAQTSRRDKEVVAGPSRDGAPDAPRDAGLPSMREPEGGGRAQRERVRGNQGETALGRTLGSRWSDARDGRDPRAA
jgi:hypothetical protein